MKKTNLLFVCTFLFLLGTARNAFADLGGISLEAGNNVSINCGVVNISTGVMTAECWVYDTGEKACDYISSANFNENNGFRLFIDGGSISFRIINGSNNTALWVSKDDYIGKWTHYAAVADGSKIRLYVNGELKNEADAVFSTAFSSGSGLIIGNAIWGEQQLVGKITEVRLWETVRTAAEIADNYAKELTGTESGLYGYWKFNEQEGTTTGNVVDGTRNGGYFNNLNGVVWDYANKTPSNIQFSEENGKIKITWESGWDTEWEVMVNGNSQAGLTTREHTATLNIGDVIKIRSTVPTVSTWAEKTYGETGLLTPMNQISDYTLIRNGNELILNASKPISNIKIHSISGALAIEAPDCADRMVFDIQSLSNGLYIISFKLGDNFISCKWLK